MWLSRGGLDLVKNIIDVIVRKKDEDICQRLGTLFAVLASLDASILYLLPEILAVVLEKNTLSARSSDVHRILTTLNDPPTSQEDFIKLFCKIAEVCQQRS